MALSSLNPISIGRNNQYIYYGEVTIDIYKDIFDHFNIQK